MLTSLLGLCECLLENLVRKTVALDIHLSGSQTLGGTRGLEVHVAEVVLIAEDIREHSILLFARILDQTHGDTAHGSLDGHTGIHQCKRTGTNGSH